MPVGRIIFIAGSGGLIDFLFFLIGTSEKIRCAKHIQNCSKLSLHKWCRDSICLFGHSKASELFVSMINDWKKFLKVYGFEKIERRDFLRSAMPVSASIYETPLRVGQREVRLNVAVEIHDPWVFEREYHVVHLKGDVKPEGIYVNYDETPRWLHPEEKEQVYEVIHQCLMDWVKRWSEPQHLIRYFEHPVDIIMTRPLPASPGCEHIFGVPAKRRASPHKNYLLSLLYYHIGDFQKALAFAQSYFQFVEQRTAYEGEPQRTKRQIEEISSKISQDI